MRPLSKTPYGELMAQYEHNDWYCWLPGDAVEGPTLGVLDRLVRWFRGVKW